MDMNKRSVRRNMTKIIMKSALFTTQCRLLTNLKKKPFENTQIKGENAGNQYFLHLP